MTNFSYPSAGALLTGIAGRITTNSQLQKVSWKLMSRHELIDNISFIKLSFPEEMEEIYLNTTYGYSRKQYNKKKVGSLLLVKRFSMIYPLTSSKKSSVFHLLSFFFH